MNMVSTPNIFCLVEGAGEGRTLLNAFDQALLAAGVGDTNLMRMSSIVPPGAKQRKSVTLPRGGLIPVAYAHIDSNKPGEVISAAIAVALPEDPDLAGVIMEFEDRAPLQEVEAKVRQMAQDAFEHRNRKLAALFSTGVEHTVKECAAVFAGAVLWYE